MKQMQHFKSPSKVTNVPVLPEVWVNPEEGIVDNADKSSIVTDSFPGPVGICSKTEIVCKPVEKVRISAKP